MVIGLRNHLDPFFPTSAERSPESAFVQGDDLQAISQPRSAGIKCTFVIQAREKVSCLMKPRCSGLEPKCFAGVCCGDEDR